MTYFGNTTLPHGMVSGTPAGRLTLAPGERLSSIFGTSSNYLNSIGFRTDQGLTYGLWGNFRHGTPYRFVATLTGFFGSTGDQGLTAVGVWASDGSTPQPPPPRPSPPNLAASGFDANEPCPQTPLTGSDIGFRLMENQVWFYFHDHRLVLYKSHKSTCGAFTCGL